MWSSEINEHMKDEEEFIDCFPYDKLPQIKDKKKNFSLIISTVSSLYWARKPMNGWRTPVMGCTKSW